MWQIFNFFPQLDWKLLKLNFRLNKLAQDNPAFELTLNLIIFYKTGEKLWRCYCVPMFVVVPLDDYSSRRRMFVMTCSQRRASENKKRKEGVLAACKGRYTRHCLRCRTDCAVEGKTRRGWVTGNHLTASHRSRGKTATVISVCSWGFEPDYSQVMDLYPGIYGQWTKKGDSSTLMWRMMWEF